MLLFEKKRRRNSSLVRGRGRNPGKTQHGPKRPAVGPADPPGSLKPACIYAPATQHAGLACSTYGDEGGRRAAPPLGQLPYQGSPLLMWPFSILMGAGHSWTV